MTLRHVASASLVFALVVAPVALFAQAQGQTQAKPEQKPDPKADAKPTTPAGKWNMNIETQGGARQATLDLKIDGKKVAGSIASEIGETAVTGEFVEGKLTFAISIDANGQTLNITFTGTTTKDGTLAGTASMEGAEMTWTATRVKGS
jgi:hypothetical protein